MFNNSKNSPQVSAKETDKSFKRGWSPLGSVLGNRFGKVRFGMVRKLFAFFCFALLSVSTLRADDLADRVNFLNEHSASFHALYMQILRAKTDRVWTLQDHSLPGKEYGRCSVQQDGSIVLLVDRWKAMKNGVNLYTTIAHEFKHLHDAVVLGENYTQASSDENTSLSYRSRPHEEAAFAFQDVVRDELEASK